MIFYFSVTVSPLSVLVLFIWVLSLFILMSLAKGLSIWTVQKSSSSFYLSFLFVCLHFISFSPWSLLFPSFSWLRALVVVVVVFNSFRWSFRLFIWDFSYFLEWACISVNFSLRTAFALSINFKKLCIHFNLSQCILWFLLFFFIDTLFL